MGACSVLAKECSPWACSSIERARNNMLRRKLQNYKISDQANGAWRRTFFAPECPPYTTLNFETLFKGRPADGNQLFKHRLFMLYPCCVVLIVCVLRLVTMSKPSVGETYLSYRRVVSSYNIFSKNSSSKATTSPHRGNTVGKPLN